MEITEMRSQGAWQSSNKLTATGLVNGEWQILTTYRIDTPEPIAAIFRHTNPLRETKPSTKFGANSSTGTSRQIGEI